LSDSEYHRNFPKVSVVISTFDRPEMLDKALASIHAQKYDDFEVVVVDDCSPDREAVKAVYEKWGNAFDLRQVDFFGYFLGENTVYQCVPKNKAIENSRGDYIAYLDDDNTWRPEHLSSCVEAIEADFSTDMVYSRLSYTMESEELLGSLQATYGPTIQPGDAIGKEWDPGALAASNYIDTSTILHSKGAFWRMVRNDGYGWDESLRRFGDWNFVWRWAVAGNTAKLVDKVTVDYVFHKGCMQLSRPPVEVPVCISYAAYRAMRKDRDNALSAAS
jgi:glycosyltransferase involved in cell wall biosynthesis